VHRGATTSLLSDEYRALLEQQHRLTKWTEDGQRKVNKLLRYVDEFGASSVLDYGSGKGRMGVLLAEARPELTYYEYEPGIPAKAGEPPCADLVWCSHVLEHVEPECLEAVLEHIASKAPVAVFLIPFTRSRELLLDGRNAHLIQQGPTFWLPTLKTWYRMVHQKRLRKTSTYLYLCQHPYQG
jgi:hypothetical protein